MTSPRDLARTLRGIHASGTVDPQAVRQLVALLKAGEMPPFEAHTERDGQELLAFGRCWLDILSRRPGATVEQRAQVVAELRDNWPKNWTPDAVAVAARIAAFIAQAHEQNTEAGDDAELLQESTL